MSRDLQPDEGSHICGFPNRPSQDRHIQSIIEHTSNLFPDLNYHSPRLELSHSAAAGGLGLRNPLNDMRDGDSHLDDFDRRLLGQPGSSTSGTSLNAPSNRLSLPLSSASNRTQRVLGDASHHFRPFIPRNPDYRSQFAHNPLQLGGPEYAVSSTQPSSDGGSSHTLGEVRPSTQLTMAPQSNISNAEPVASSLTSSSPPNLGLSSPSTRLSLRQQSKGRPHLSANAKLPQHVQMDLDHAPSVTPVVNNTRLVDPRQALPDRFRMVFPYKLFNAVQSKSFPIVYGTNDNVVISAPTGSGKTAILEMAICKLVGSQGGENFKIVYQAPTKSLCSERAKDWEKKFSHMNLSCIELTGDTHVRANRVGNASIIVTTPEKWDSITRKWKDHGKLLEMIRLVLIDEVHMLKDVRGATLEAVVSRMKTIGAHVRFVALSATVPNIEDIAKWLGRNHATRDEPAKYETFGEELRPVKLQRYVYGYEGGLNDFAFDKILDGKLTLLLGKHLHRKPIMVFCCTRQSCVRTARVLAEWWSTRQGENRPWPPPTQRISVISPDLQELVSHGVAFHHAGLDVQDRTAVAQNFLGGQLHVICCTSTLAVGVNLPCHTVVLKGTVAYTDNGAQEYSDLEVMQMLGRAGRPQFDNSAVAVIMTRMRNAERYERMITGKELLESTLHRNLVEHLNSEVGLGTIQDVQGAKQWLGGTFLSVRMRQSPANYNLEDVNNAAGAEERMEEWCERDIKLLQENGLITKQSPFRGTEYGQAMSRYMVQFETMKLLLSVSRGATIEQMLTTLCQASEFKEFRFKPAERIVFRELNKSSFVLHPIKETITQTWHKIFMIVQIHLGGVELPNEKDISFIKQDLQRVKKQVFDRLNRLVRCIVDCKAFDGDGLGTKNALELARAIAANSWENKPSQLSQIPGFGPVTVRKWASHGVLTVLGIADKSFLDIERIASRNPPYGRNLLKTLEDFPRLTMKADVDDSRVPQNGPVSVTLRVNLGHSNTRNAPTWKSQVPALTFVVVTTDGALAYFWRSNMKNINGATGINLRFPVALTAPNQKITCYFSCEEIVGTQVVKKLEPRIPASVFRSAAKSRTNSNPLEQGVLDIAQDHEYEDYEDYGDEVADEDMLHVVEDRTANGSKPSPELLDEAEDDLPPIEDLLSRDDLASALASNDNPISSSIPEPAKMDNGRWMCSHACRNGGRTKSGKPCSHKCCREGVEKPRKRGTQQPEARIENARDESRQISDLVPAKSVANMRRTRHLDDIHSPKDSKRVKPNDYMHDLDSFIDIECIDLSALSDDDNNEKGTGSASISWGGPETPAVRGSHLSNTSSLTDNLKDNSKSVGFSQQTWGEDDGTSTPFGRAALDMTLSPGALGMESDQFSTLPSSHEPLSATTIAGLDSSQPQWNTDETLYPGVVETLKESMDYG
ncbi:hypothetical protein GGR56DRAFT_665524 [Xylariaceae sp. FL0804]|nr:hypothetical protein GGR56DRAFT_665524 [Xylariaceae sp. FL0804]